MALERPGPSEVQARLEIRRQDPAEPQLHADLAGRDCEQSASKPEECCADGSCVAETARGNGNAGQLRGSVPEPDPFVRNARPTHAEDQQAGEQHGSGALDEIRDEAGCGAERYSGVETPGLVYRVEGETGSERHNDE